MYDVTNLESFNNLAYWLRNIHEVSHPAPKWPGTGLSLSLLLTALFSAERLARCGDCPSGEQVWMSTYTTHGREGAWGKGKISAPSTHLSFYSFVVGGGGLEWAHLMARHEGDTRNWIIFVYSRTPLSSRINNLWLPRLPLATNLSINMTFISFQIAENFDIPFFEVSCKQDVNIEESFITLARRIRDQRDRRVRFFINPILFVNLTNNP